DAGASNPTVAVDPRTGTAYVAWVGVQSGNADVYLARIERGEAGAPVRVNDIPGDAAPHEQAPAQVAVAPNGDVLVLWQNNTPVEGRRFPASDLRLARSTDGGRTFEPAVTVNDDAGGLPSSHTFHDIAVAPDGTVYVSWIDSRERDRARAALGIVEDATMGHGGNGGAAAAAGEADLPSSDVRVARPTDGGRTFEPGGGVAAGLRRGRARHRRRALDGRGPHVLRAGARARRWMGDPGLPARRRVARRGRRGTRPRRVVHRPPGAAGHLPRRLHGWRPHV